MKKIFLALFICSLFSCSKQLDLKPDSSLVIPKTTQDFTAILDNSPIMNITPALAQISADEYFVLDLPSLKSLINITPRNAYLWTSDIYQGETKIPDWVNSYKTIYYCNNVLDALATQDITNDPDKMNLKGWALFSRSYAFYFLASIFSKGYDGTSASTDLGIPLKLSANIDEIVERSSVQQTYDQITKDILTASSLLRQDITVDKRNRPSKVAAFAMLARVYLSMRKYDLAESYADKAMQLYSTLTDFNTLSTTTRSAFNYNSVETIYFTQQLGAYQDITQSTINTGIDTNLMKLYEPNDLRLAIYFAKNDLGRYYKMKSVNSAGGSPFTGLATDELFLIKAECLARKGSKDASLSFLNTLVKSRMKTSTFLTITAATAEDALEKILTERRKSLIWRSLRWTDLKRLNLEGRNIVLTRNLGGQSYNLMPNSNKYELPIPPDEVALSGIVQNIR